MPAMWLPGCNVVLVLLKPRYQIWLEQCDREGRKSSFEMAYGSDSDNSKLAVVPGVGDMALALGLRRLG